MRLSIRPSVAVLQQFSSHACYSSINVMLEMSFIIVFIVSSSAQSIPNAVRAQGQTSPHNSPYSRFGACHILLHDQVLTMS